MTGQSCEDWRFQSLYKRLDPEERGITVDFSTFYSVMKDWIADCRQEGEEAADLMNSIKDLQQGNKQLAVQNIKLQRTIETAEELNSRLSEEISELKGKLKSTQQALDQARAVANELEDLRFFSKNLEEEKNRLYSQVRQLEKEQQFLSVQVDNLQEENKKLLLEKENSTCKIKELFTKKAKMKFQLCEYENLISCKDAAINEKTKQTEELTVILDEYRTVVEELKMEIKRLQDHLCQAYQLPDMNLRDSLQNMKTCFQAPMQPLCMEIEESQKQEFGESNHLPSPLCGVLPSFMKHPVVLENINSSTEELEVNGSRADGRRALLQRTYSLSHLTLVTDAKLILKNKEPNQKQQYFSSEMLGSKEKPKQIGVTPNRNEIWTCSSNKETQVAFSAFPEITVASSTELSSERALEEQALVPVHGELTPAIENPDGTLFEILLQWFGDIPLHGLLFILQKLLLPGLLMCVSLLAILFLVLPYDQHPNWIEPKGPNPWPQLQLQYLRPPPV
ncbi:protein KASH5 isoform X2 [Sceloporus undulatus]|uniref:protein KASH5 isoform X2 n=1 Tax=Sceloporus undulatus TaxID=8520 RepID=UPI001C4B6883|nr:protein KASH5 isoform X2 [Sceloporus undulatus]